MASCNSSLSWDGVLCELCRHFFDSHLTDMSLAMQKLNGERESHWWHDIGTLQQCANRQCRLCGLVLANFRDDDTLTEALDNMASWDVCFTAKVMDPYEGGCQLYINYPIKDPRPVCADPPDYGNIALQLSFDALKGIVNPLNVLECRG